MILVSVIIFMLFGKQAWIFTVIHLKDDFCNLHIAEWPFQTNNIYFMLDSRMWSLLSSAQGGPGPRHGHSAMTHQDCMYLFGGLQGLKEQKDLWSWNFASQTWSRIHFQWVSLLTSIVPSFFNSVCNIHLNSLASWSQLMTLFSVKLSYNF